MSISALVPGLAAAGASARAGLSRAAAAAGEAAERIAGSGTAPAAGRLPPAPPLPELRSADEPSRAITDLLRARRAYEANAAVLGAVDAMAKDLLRRTA